MARLNTQVVDLRGRVLHQSEDKASWKAEVLSEMRESLQAIRRQTWRRSGTVTIA